MNQIFPGKSGFVSLLPLSSYNFTRVNILAGDANFFLSGNLDYPYFFLEFHGFFDAAACVAELLRQLTKEIEEEKARSAKILRIF